jgi:L-arabinose isomerase C-terminal domain
VVGSLGGDIVLEGDGELGEVAVADDAAELGFGFDHPGGGPAQAHVAVLRAGEVLEHAELPKPEMPYGFFRRRSGVRECINAWLRLGGPHHQVLNPGHVAGSWEVFGELSGIEVLSVQHLGHRRPDCGIIAGR